MTSPIDPAALAPTPQLLVGLLAQPVRTRVFAAVVLGATSPAQVVQRTGLTQREVVSALRRLESGGLVGHLEGNLVAHVDAFEQAARAQAAAGGEVDPAAGEPDRFRAGVLRAFFSADGRLSAIPVPHSKRRVVLEQIVTAFEPGVRYPERQVNAILRAWHDDHAALRRYLVDEHLLARENGVYWRIGGPVWP